MRVFGIIVLVAAMISTTGCGLIIRDWTVYSEDTYKGTGTMTDHGGSSGLDRFVLDLGEVDLSKPSTVSYKMSNLPPVKLDLLVHMTHFPPDASAYNTAIGYNKSQIKVTLKTDTGKLVAQHEKPLSKWGWSPNRDDAGQLTYTARDFGWGSAFTPKKNEAFVLTLEITPDPSSTGTTPGRVRVAGGGWVAP